MGVSKAMASVSVFLYVGGYLRVLIATPDTICIDLDLFV